jgi:hypothetical protein
LADNVVVVVGAKGEAADGAKVEADAVENVVGADVVVVDVVGADVVVAGVVTNWLAAAGAEAAFRSAMNWASSKRPAPKWAAARAWAGVGSLSHAPMAATLAVACRASSTVCESTGTLTGTS